MRAISRWLILGMMLCVAGTADVWAEYHEPTTGGQDRMDVMMSRYNLGPAFTKLGRGVSNAVTGVLDALKSLRDAKKKKP